MRKQKTVYTRQGMIEWLDAISLAFELQRAYIKVTWKKKNSWDNPTQVWKAIVIFK